MEDRKISKVITQAEKFKRLTGHPMHKRINVVRERRLKRTNFVALAQGEIGKHDALAKATAVSLTAKVPSPPWRRTELPELICAIPGIVDKKLQTPAERKSIAVEFIKANYPQAQWTHAFTDGSAKNATENGGGGVYIKLIHKVHTISVATGKYCNNFKAEAAALAHAATALRVHISDSRDKVVIFTDALSVVTALSSPHSTDLSDLAYQLEQLTLSYQKVVIQWVPAHCDIKGNEKADKLAKMGGALQQEDLGSTFAVARSVIKNHLSEKWAKDHPTHQKGDAYHQLPRHAQVTILRLRTGHNRLRHHMYTKFKIGETELCTCGTAAMTAQHLLEECPSYDAERAETWERAVTLQDKLYGSAENLELTTRFFKLINVIV
jgi:ribonuclease HI